MLMATVQPYTKQTFVATSAKMFQQSLCLKVLGTVVKRSASNRCFHFTPLLNSPGRWKRIVPDEGPDCGPMKDLPDWSYADGTPAPLSPLDKGRIKLNKEYCEQIMKLNAEIDECLELNKQKATNEEQLRQDFRKNRLKEKGETFS